MRLDDLHDVLQVAMGWTDSHLHQFVVRTPKKKPTDEQLEALLAEDRFLVNWAEVDGERRWSNPDFELDYDEDEAKARLDQLVGKPKDKLFYKYDFGDGWEHELLVEKITPMDPTATYPRCLAGKRSCPPEDCGGPWGYADLLQALTDPSHERHAELVEWIGNEFHPERFDAGAVNAAFDDLTRE